MRSSAPPLDAGSPFPPLRVPKVGGGHLSLPDDLARDFSVVLLNRGHW